MSDAFDLVVLGAGSAGYACALRAAQLGLSVALVDEGAIGGTCLHRGCIPTKAWLQAAKVRRTVAKAASFGIGAELGDVDAAVVGKYAAGVVGGLHKGLEGLIAARGITVIREHGTLTVDERGPGVETGSVVHRGRAVVLATGAAPVTLGLPVDGERIITSEHALTLDTLPKRAIVVGGGVIGVEFASLWADLGVESRSSRWPLTGSSLQRKPATRKILTSELRKSAASISGSACRWTGPGPPTAGWPSRSMGRISESDLMLVAVGRRPVTDGLRRCPKRASP